MLQIYSEFLSSFADDIQFDEDNVVQRVSESHDEVATGMIYDSISGAPGLMKFPSRDPLGSLHKRLSKWLLDASQEEKELAKLTIQLPPTNVHYVPGSFRTFYDFKNSDIVLDSLRKAGATITGNLLDFGCSSGRNLATLHRAYPEGLDLYGVDPVPASINWANKNVKGVTFETSGQNPPLPFKDSFFDLIIAKSIWTHFGPRTARRWFEEVERILVMGGHMVFSTHGPHDVASRIVHNNPSPRYERFSGHESWTKDEFLMDLISGLESTGFYFQPYKTTGHQGDLGRIPDADTSEWGLAFTMPHYLKDNLLPNGLEVVTRDIARTGNRHDVYVVRKSSFSALEHLSPKH